METKEDKTSRARGETKGNRKQTNSEANSKYIISKREIPKALAGAMEAKNSKMGRL